jgi:hypothetical protein
MGRLAEEILDAVFGGTTMYKHDRDGLIKTIDEVIASKVKNLQKKSDKIRKVKIGLGEEVSSYHFLSEIGGEKMFIHNYRVKHIKFKEDISEKELEALEKVKIEGADKLEHKINYLLHLVRQKTLEEVL